MDERNPRLFPMPVIDTTKDDRITELERQLAEVTRERDVAKESAAEAWMLGKELRPTYEKEIADALAREQQLREALEGLEMYLDPESDVRSYREACVAAREALATPTDDTALRAWGAKLLREMADEIHDDYGSDRDSAATLRRKAAALEPKK